MAPPSGPGRPRGSTTGPTGGGLLVAVPVSVGEVGEVVGGVVGGVVFVGGLVDVAVALGGFVVLGDAVVVTERVVGRVDELVFLGVFVGPALVDTSALGVGDPGSLTLGVTLGVVTGTTPPGSLPPPKRIAAMTTSPMTTAAMSTSSAIIAGVSANGSTRRSRPRCDPPVRDRPSDGVAGVAGPFP